MESSSVCFLLHRQECWRGLPFPSPGDLPDLGFESPALQADSLLTELQGNRTNNTELSCRLRTKCY